MKNLGVRVTIYFLKVALWRNAACIQVKLWSLVFYTMLKTGGNFGKTFRAVRFLLEMTGGKEVPKIQTKCKNAIDP